MAAPGEGGCGIRILHVDQRRLAADGDVLPGGGDLQGEIHRAGLAQARGDRLVYLLVETRCLDAHRIGARTQLREGETPRFVRLDLALEPRLPVRDCHRGPGHRSTAHIVNLPRDGAGGFPLSPQLDGAHGNGQSHRENAPEP